MDNRTAEFKFVAERPWWWLNPWLYIMRRDESALDALHYYEQMSNQKGGGE